MGALVFLSLIAAVPACAIAAVLWALAPRGRSPDAVSRRIAHAAGWTALALAFQALSFFGTAYVVLTG